LRGDEPAGGDHYYMGSGITESFWPTTETAAGLIGTPDARWNDADLSCLTSLILSDFEPVNVSSLMVTNDSGATSH
jgi:hypothetical protein